MGRTRTWPRSIYNSLLLVNNKIVGALLRVWMDSQYVDIASLRNVATTAWNTIGGLECWYTYVEHLTKWRKSTLMDSLLWEASLWGLIKDHGWNQDWFVPKTTLLRLRDSRAISIWNLPWDRAVFESWMQSRSCENATNRQRWGSMGLLCGGVLMCLLMPPNIICTWSADGMDTSEVAWS